MLRGFFGNLIFAIIARMLCGNHLKCSLHRFKEGAKFEEGPQASYTNDQHEK